MSWPYSRRSKCVMAVQRRGQCVRMRNFHCFFLLKSSSSPSGNAVTTGVDLTAWQWPQLPYFTDDCSGSGLHTFRAVGKAAKWCTLCSVSSTKVVLLSARALELADSGIIQPSLGHGVSSHQYGEVLYLNSYFKLLD